MKQFLYAGLALLASVLYNAAGAQQSYTIAGLVKNIPNAQWIYISEDWTGVDIRDSVKVENGTFLYKGIMERSYPVIGYIHVRYDDVTKPGKTVRRLLTDFFVEKGNIRINIDGLAYRECATITGGPTNEDYVAYQQVKSVYLADRARKIKEPGYIKPAANTAASEYADGLFRTASDFLRAHPNSFFSLYLLESDLMRVAKADQLLSLFSQLSTQIRNSEKGEKLSGLISNSTVVKVSSSAPDFTEKDTLGVPVSLKSFKGKYVLVDFWASWCHPCRDENPYLIAAFNEFKDHNFTILSVSLDKSRSAWLKAIKADSLLWQQVSALDPENSESALKYGVKSIPRNFLIDPSGKIVAMDLRGKQLEATLNEIFK